MILESRDIGGKIPRTNQSSTEWKEKENRELITGLIREFPINFIKISSLLNPKDDTLGVSFFRQVICYMIHKSRNIRKLLKVSLVSLLLRALSPLPIVTFVNFLCLLPVSSNVSKYEHNYFFLFFLTQKVACYVPAATWRVFPVSNFRSVFHLHSVPLDGYSTRLTKPQPTDLGLLPHIGRINTKVGLLGITCWIVSPHKRYAEVLALSTSVRDFTWK